MYVSLTWAKILTSIFQVKEIMKLIVVLWVAEGGQQLSRTVIKCWITGSNSAKTHYSDNFIKGLPHEVIVLWESIPFCKAAQIGRSMSIGYVTLVAITGTTVLVSCLLSLGNSFEDQAPVDEICGCLIFKWVAETWLQGRNPGE